MNDNEIMNQENEFVVETEAENESNGGIGGYLVAGLVGAGLTMLAKPVYRKIKGKIEARRAAKAELENNSAESNSGKTKK